MDALEQWLSVRAKRDQLIARTDNKQAPDAVRIPTRRQSKQARKGFRAMVRAEQPGSMLNMPRPARHKPVPYITGEKTKRLFAAHEKRREAGWLRG